MRHDQLDHVAIDATTEPASIPAGKRTLTSAIQRKAQSGPPAAAPATPATGPTADGSAPFWFAQGSATAPSDDGGAPLTPVVQAKMERAFGADFSGVRVHEGEQAGRVGAVAYAQGTDLHFAPGAYVPDSAAGQALIGHELAHVVQQGEGRVVAGPQGKGGAIVADAGLEAEADRHGDAAARGEIVRTGPRLIAGGGASAVQRKIAAGQEAFAGRAVIGPAGPGTIVAVMGQGYNVAFDSGPTFYVPADDLDFHDGSAHASSSGATVKKADAEPKKADAEPKKADAEPKKADAEPKKAEAPRLAGPVQVFVKSMTGKQTTFDLTPAHVADTAGFYADIVLHLAKELPAVTGKPVECFTITSGGKFIPRVGPWPEAPAPAREMTLSFAFKANAVPVVDQGLVDIVTGLAPDLVVPCSQINDTHTKDPDATAVDPHADLVRYVSIENLTRQQKLGKVEFALAQDKPFTLVLIDPSFGPDGIERHMVQIVEHLQSQGHAFAVQRVIPSHHVTIYACKHVRIAYVGVAINSATSARLPAMGSI